MNQHIIHIWCLCCVAAPFFLVHVPKLSTYQPCYMFMQYSEVSHSHGQWSTHDFLLFIVPFISPVLYIYIYIYIYIFVKHPKTHFHYDNLWLMICNLSQDWMLRGCIVCANFQNVWTAEMDVMVQGPDSLTIFCPQLKFDGNFALLLFHCWPSNHMPRQRFRIEVKQNFHRIWIAMEKPLVKRGPAEFSDIELKRIFKGIS